MADNFIRLLSSYVNKCFFLIERNTQEIIDVETRTYLTEFSDCYNSEFTLRGVGRLVSRINPHKIR